MGRPIYIICVVLEGERLRGIPHIQGKRNPSKTVGAERAPEGRQTETTVIEN